MHPVEEEGHSENKKVLKQGFSVTHSGLDYYYSCKTTQLSVYIHDLYATCSD